MKLKVDHITIAGPSLDRLREALARNGIETDYGGTHSNGITHMALTGLDDGSYLELISTMEEGAEAQLWPRFIEGDAGFCAWAVDVEDVAAEAARVAAIGVPVHGPTAMHRVRPDGVRAEWDLVVLGEGDPGRTLPFLITDRTPRSHRVIPSAAETTRGSDGRLLPDRLAGIALVVLGVAELDETVRLFRRVYGWPAPADAPNVLPDATVAFFQGSPVALAAPAAGAGWLRERLERFGPCPCACLVTATDLNAAAARFGLMPSALWFGARVAWFDPDRLAGLRLGLVSPLPSAH